MEMMDRWCSGRHGGGGTMKKFMGRHGVGRRNEGGGMMEGEPEGKGVMEGGTWE